jgi:DNA polymerase IIIc chi subunit
MRLWRARRRHDHIDVVLREDERGWVLEYTRNDRRLVERTYATEEAAREDAASRLKELRRAGWVDHW